MKTEEELLRELLEEVKEQRRYAEAKHLNSQALKQLVEELLVNTSD